MYLTVCATGLDNIYQSLQTRIRHELLLGFNCLNGIYFGRLGSYPGLLTQIPRYSASVHLNNYLSEFTFYPASVSFCKTFIDISDGLRSRFQL